jgi:hypothetical protein
MPSAHSASMTTSCQHAATLAAALGALALAYAAPSLADLPALPATNTVNISGTTAAAHPFLAGTVVKDDLVSFSDASGGTIGQVQTRVVRETGSGTLDFYFRVLNDAKSKESVSVLFARDYTGFDPISVDFRTDGVGSKGPDTVRRTGAGTGQRTVEFQFTQDDNIVNPGDGSFFFFVHTDATNFQQATGELRLGGLEVPNPHFSKPFAVWAPAAAVPEPQTWALLAGGLVVAGVTVRRRKASA